MWKRVSGTHMHEDTLALSLLGLPMNAILYQLNKCPLFWVGLGALW